MMYCTGGIRCDIYSTYLRQKVRFRLSKYLGRGGEGGYGGVYSICMQCIGSTHGEI